MNQEEQFLIAVFQAESCAGIMLLIDKFNLYAQFHVCER